MKIGLVLPVAEYPWKQPSYVEIRDLALRAEDSGFESVWVYDHLLFREPGLPTEGIWEAWTVLAALAEATERVELGTLVLCTAFRNPAVLAKMAVTLDEVSGGRLILGLGCGWHQPEFDAFGIPFDHRVDRFEEALGIILPLLRTGELDRYEGRHHWVRGGELRPRGPRPGGPPVLVAARGPRMLRLAAEHADLWNGCWFGPPETAGEALSRLKEASAEVGRAPGTLGVTLGVNVSVGEPGPQDHPVLAGSPEQVAEGLLAYRDLGVDHLVCNLNPHDRASQRRLATALRGYHDRLGSTTGRTG
ncbi:LLM class flavin-dependent oxidoreductase [Sphaerisporangium sp. NPDC005289]|uniref:LLM class flavin-dependent oxidoreductase n=1 Tax=Sphaerisporangium sp. NPDC005289 TaxID=3155247 RepID=UPI0033A0D7C6